MIIALYISPLNIKGMYILEKMVVKGGKPLFGEVTVSGAKNAAVAIIPAAILVDGVCTIENVPNIQDVKVENEQNFESKIESEQNFENENIDNKES